MVLH
jgi:hypothetical protein